MLKYVIFFYVLFAVAIKVNEVGMAMGVDILGIIMAVLTVALVVSCIFALVKNRKVGK
jgi:hypothetical protein